LMGWRDICRSTDVRTLIANVLPRNAVVGDFACFEFAAALEKHLPAVFLANLNSLVVDFIARQKVSGAHLKQFHIRQLPLFAVQRYSENDLTYIVTRVLELTHTAHDMQPWADDLVAYDPRPADQRQIPFPWNPDRRAQLRAELDAYFACLYGLTRDELRYILDPADVMGPDYPSETFRVLKNGEMRAYGEYRTQRLVLAAWDKLAREAVSPVGAIHK
jgi:hypothetical protein